MGLGPISRGDMIAKFHALGWTGPYSGRRHQFMIKGTHKQRIPNPHKGDVGVSLLREVLRQAEIAVDDWNNA